MKLVTFIFSLFLFFGSYAHDGDQTLEVEKDGLSVVIVDFKEGDKIKLFEVETGDHILSKTIGRVDLSQLPIGKYLLEDNEGRSTVIERTEEGISVDAEDVVKSDFVLGADSEMVYISKKLEVQYEEYYKVSQSDMLNIKREGDIITVVGFEEGDKIKLFELKGIVHILSKTTGFVDLSQLPEGVYVLENNKGRSVIVEKFSDDDQLADM